MKRTIILTEEQSEKLIKYMVTEQTQLNIVLDLKNFLDRHYTKGEQTEITPNTASDNTIQLGNSSIANVYRGSGTASSFNTTSDERIKENIIAANTSICLSDINRLKVKRFSYKDFVNSSDDKTITGFIAQEFKEVFPKQVSETKRIYQIEGKEEIIFDDLLSIDTSQVIYTLVGAIQELTKRVEELENKS